MPWRVRLSGPANADLHGIVAWTQREFGATQACRYAAAVGVALDRLAQGPDADGSVQCNEAAPGLRRLHLRRFIGRARHVLFYRTEGDGLILVIRILHDAMDPERHLAPHEDA